MNIDDEGRRSRTSRRSLILLALSSLVIGSGAFWLTVLRYESLAKQSDFYWYSWVQLAGIALVSILCLWAAILFILGRPSGRSVFKLGLSVVPIILFVNLMILVFRGIQNIFQGNANFFFERVFAQPYKILFILAIVIVLTILSSLNEKRGQ